MLFKAIHIGISTKYYHRVKHRETIQLLSSNRDCVTFSGRNYKNIPCFERFFKTIGLSQIVQKFLLKARRTCVVKYCRIRIIKAQNYDRRHSRRYHIIHNK